MYAYAHANAYTLTFSSLGSARMLPYMMTCIQAHTCVTVLVHGLQVRLQNDTAKVFKGSADVLKQTIKQEGLQGLLKVNTHTHALTYARPHVNYAYALSLHFPPRQC